MKQVKTNDGSVTFHNEEYDDHYHSKSGAIEESFLKFARPANIAGRKNIKILDIGFGLGYNVAAAIEEFFSNKNAEKIEIISLEKDKKILEEIQKLNPELRYYDAVKSAAKNLEYTDEKIKIKIILGDAAETIKSINEKFDVVFLDAFSPLKNPELWTLEFFRAVFFLMEKEGILTTYSYSKNVRENLKNAGFIVEKGPIVGRWSPSTIARK